MSGSPQASARPRKWDVIHACDNARQVADVLDAQACANIRAYIVSRPRPANDSLLQSWNEVRKWSGLLAQHLGEPPFDSAGLVIHAHSFAAGMAGIRSDEPCVYDVSLFIEEWSVEASRAWLGRSFRAAEQFVLTQAAAIVVHKTSLREALVSRGVQGERVFLIPAVTQLLPDDSAAQALRQRLAIAENEITIFCEAMDFALADAVLTEHRTQPLRLLLTESASMQMATLPQVDKLAQMTVSLSQDNHSAAIAAADLAITTSEESLAMAMTHGKPSLSTDTDSARSVTPEGAGVVWCDAANPADRARRLTYMLRDRAMREAVGSSARQFIIGARSLERIGKMYEEVYRFAVQARRNSKKTPPDGHLVPVSANL